MTDKSLQPLSSDDLYYYADKLGIPNFSVLMHDDLIDRIPEENENIIMNLDHDGGDGTHWVVIINSSRLGYMLYYDPYGVIPSEIVRDYSLSSGKQLYFSDEDYQHLKSVLCGWYCLFFLYQFNIKKKDPKKIIQLFSDNNPQQNEFLMIEFAKQLLDK